MPIEFACGECGRKLSVPDKLVGAAGVCPCGASVKVPTFGQAITISRCLNEADPKGLTVPVRDNAGVWILAIASAAVFCAAWFALPRYEPPLESPASRTDRTNERIALKCMQDFVRDRLKAPSTAEFPGGMFDDVSDHVISDDRGAYRIASYVDAENSFGAMLRTHYSGRIRIEPNGEWTLLELDLMDGL
jgi:hypothetical protein